MTKTERRFDDIYSIGCIACLMDGLCDIPCQAHHLNLGGNAGQKQLGDEFTIGLCPWHHQGTVPYGASPVRMKAQFGPSLSRQSKAFREEYGSDDELLAYQNQLIAERRAAA